MRCFTYALASPAPGFSTTKKSGKEIVPTAMKSLPVAELRLPILRALPRARQNFNEERVSVRSTRNALIEDHDLNEQRLGAYEVHVDL